MLNTQALALMVIEKKIFYHYKPMADIYVFPIVSLWELSVAMETTILIQYLKKKTLQSIPLPSNCSSKI